MRFRSESEGFKPQTHGHSNIPAQAEKPKRENFFGGIAGELNLSHRQPWWPQPLWPQPYP